MNSVIALVLKIPPFLWIILTGAFGYMDYTDWETNQYQPLLAQVESKQIELQQIRQTMARIQDFQARKDEKLKEINDLADSFEKAKREFPTGPALTDLLRSLADITEKLGMEFSSFKPESTVSEELLQAAKIRVKLKGSYVQVMSFLDQVSNMTRVVNAESLELRPIAASGTSQAGTEAQFSDIEADVMILTYFLGAG